MAFLALIPAGVAAAVSAGSAVVGAGVSAAGAISTANAASAAGEAQKQAAEADAKQLEGNAKLARAAAFDAEHRGNVEAGKAREQAGRVVGEQREAYGSSGVDVNSGTAARLQDDTRAIGTIDAQTILNNAAREGWGLRTQADQMVKQAKQARQQGGWAKENAGAAVTGSILTGTGQVVGGLGQAATSYYGWKSADDALKRELAKKKSGG